MEDIMKSIWKKLPSLLALSVATFFAACSNSSSSMIYIPPSDSSGVNYFSYAALSCRAYIGGSLIYNPDSSALSQLSYGVKIAVRTSVLEKKSVSIYQVGTGSTLRTDTTVSVGENGSWASGSAETFDDYITEKEGSEVFGYIVVMGVGATSINFNYYYYPVNGLSHATQSFHLKLGESARLGSSSSIIKYEMPQIARKGFENARWLTFVNSEDSMSACMYSCVPEVNGNASALYGVNSDKSFIFLIGGIGDEGDYYPTSLASVVNMVSYGDYIIDQDNNTMYSVAGDVKANGLAALKTEKDYDGNTSAGVEGAPESFLRYAYHLYQFPDQENGPKMFFESLPKAAQDLANSNFEYSLYKDDGAIFYVKMLNWILCDKESLTIIANDLESKGKSEYATEIKDAVAHYHSPSSGITFNQAKWEDAFINASVSFSKTAEDFENANNQYVETFRSIMDEVYDHSPDAYVDPPSLFNIYPDIALDMGSAGYTPEDFAASDIFSASLVDNPLISMSSTKSSKYKEYTDKRDAIEKKFSEFHRMDLAKVNGNRLSVVGVNFAIGVKGKVIKNLGIKSGELGIKGLGAAIFVKAEATLQKIDLGEHSFFSKEELEKMTKDLHKPITFSIGPIPCVYKTQFSWDVGWTAKVTTNVKFMAGFTGLYGGEVDLGAKWGVKFKWKVIPVGGYFDPWPTNAHAINEHAAYIGPAAEAPDQKEVGLDVGVYVKGTLKPQFGVGFSYVSAGLQVVGTLQPELHFIIGDKFISPPYNTPFHMQGLLKALVTFGPYFEVTIPIIGKKIKTDWTAVKILDKSSGDKPIEIFDLPLSI